MSIEAERRPDSEDTHLLEPKFCELKPHAKFQSPRTTPSGRMVTRGEKREREREREREEERTNAVNNGQYVLPARPKGSRAAVFEPTNCLK